MEPSRGKSICVPFDSDEHYAACVADPESFRQHLTEVFGLHPELFPARTAEGFVLHDKRCPSSNSSCSGVLSSRPQPGCSWSGRRF